MNNLSKLEMERLQEIFFTIYEVIKNDDVGITWDLEPLVKEGLKMVLTNNE